MFYYSIKFKIESNKNILSMYKTKMLPIEIINYILSFAPITPPCVNCVKQLIEDYGVDHNWDYTKTYKMYYIKNIMSFSSYYFSRLYYPEEFLLEQQKNIYYSDE